MAVGRKTGGRKKGSMNKAPRERAERAAASGLLPHEFLLAVCRGEVFDGHVPSFDERLDAAGKAAPYYAPKLANVEHTGKDGGAIVTRVEVVIVDAPG
jgi:hypothetical protein